MEKNPGKCKLKTEIQKIANKIHMYLSKCNPKTDNWKVSILSIIEKHLPGLGFLINDTEDIKDVHPILNFLLNTGIFSNHEHSVKYGSKLISEMYNVGYRNGIIKGHAPEIIGKISSIIKQKYSGRIENNEQVIEIFKEIVRSDKNVLQGSKTQIFALHYLIDQPWYGNFKDNLYNGTTKQKWLYYSSLQSIFDSMGSGHEIDLDTRTLMIREYVKNSNINTIILMDGHGRTISRVAEIFNSLPDDTEFELLTYELDCYNDLWHKNTTPLDKDKKFLSYDRNIFEAFEDDRFLKGNAFVYVNFSGLVNQGDRMVETIKNISSINPKLLQNIMISFSCDRSGEDPCNKTHLGLLEFGFTPLTTRSTTHRKKDGEFIVGKLKQGDFVTMGLPTLRRDVELFEEELPPDTSLHLIYPYKSTF